MITDLTTLYRIHFHRQMCLLLWLCSILFIAISADITGDRINGTRLFFPFTLSGRSERYIMRKMKRRLLVRTLQRTLGFTATSTMDLARFLGYNHLNVIDLLKVFFCANNGSARNNLSDIASILSARALGKKRLSREGITIFSQ